MVWRVRDTEAGADLAVKVVARRPGSLVDPARRAETEARALARLEGLSGVVALHEVGRTSSGDAWLAHDLVTGGTLVARAPMRAEDVVEVGRQLARTLGEAHRREVCHGDVSPSNVLFDHGGAPVLADFGMAGLGHAPDDPGGLTPAYAAPERLRGAPPTAAADVWSLAATMAAVVEPGVQSSLQQSLVDVMARCRDLDPSRRPDAEALANELAGLRSR